MYIFNILDVFTRGYRKDYLRKNISNEYDVDLSFKLNEILEISEERQTLVTMFSLLLSWYDQRLQYHDLQAAPHHNTLDNKRKKKIWIPDVKFINNHAGVLTSSIASDRSAKVKVERNSLGKKNSPRDAMRRILYEGHENKIKKLGYYSVNTVCIFDLVFFPFDRQTCEIEMDIESSNRTPPRIRPALHPSSLRVEKYGKYLVTNISIEEQGARVKVVINLGRSLLGSLLTVHMPTMIINIINQATVYFGPDHFHTTVTVNISSMMVLSGLLISVANSLPPTTYIKVRRINED